MKKSIVKIVVPEINNEHSEIGNEQLQIPTEESINTEECGNKTDINKPVLRRSLRV